MAKKPIMTDEHMDGDRPARPVPPTPLSAAPPGATRPVDPPAPPQAPAPTHPVSAAPTGRDASGHVRPKTRILGYGAAPEAAQTGDVPVDAPAVGWLVVTHGPGRGASLAVTSGMNAIGRGEDCGLQLDFGDDSISRDAHAYVTYDNEARRFFVSHGGKTNLVRLNDTSVLTTEPLTHGDTLRIGATSLRFVALCGPDFDWSDP
ncbi:FHA domain-containing protein [Jannaschia sp. CCS1]|uniref:FHA domain-containing protein n=1 Tax=Jannaschia sp. (strain CCS1) TaxID=290400 RepID=UPI000053CD61|nr:FHA domain-containing protein [Jannaschia sp. CCS1]ABD54522.1 FHA domain containing protein [Jannaschia sp. CCS1]